MIKKINLINPADVILRSRDHRIAFTIDQCNGEYYVAIENMTDDSYHADININHIITAIANSLTYPIDGRRFRELLDNSKYANKNSMIIVSTDAHDNSENKQHYSYYHYTPTSNNGNSKLYGINDSVTISVGHFTAVSMPQFITLLELINDLLKHNLISYYRSEDFIYRLDTSIDPSLYQRLPYYHNSNCYQNISYNPTQDYPLIHSVNSHNIINNILRDYYKVKYSDDIISSIADYVTMSKTAKRLN